MRKINEIFYSLQGEGAQAGTPAIFIRFSGCNLHCDFCDTKHENGVMMNDDEIIAEVEKYTAELVVLTGGEPSLQIDKAFIDRLHASMRRVAIETNGTHTLPNNIDWVTVSPKDNANVVLTLADEVKVVYQHQNLEPYFKLSAIYYFLQPCDTGNAEANRLLMRDAIEACKADPRWRLSVQMHKIIGIQ